MCLLLERLQIGPAGPRGGKDGLDPPGRRIQGYRECMARCSEGDHVRGGGCGVACSGSGDQHCNCLLLLPRAFPLSSRVEDKVNRYVKMCSAYACFRVKER